MTVFLAGSALGILEHLETDGAAEVSGSDLKCCMEERQQFIVRRTQDGTALFSGQEFVVQRLFDQGCVVHVSLKKVTIESSGDLLIRDCSDAIQQIRRSTDLEFYEGETYTVSNGEAMP